MSRHFLTAPPQGPVPAIVLVGGLGTRLASALPGLPKALAPVNGKPFLDFLLERLEKQGVVDIVLATGHLAEKVEAYAAAFHHPGIRLRCVREPRPLGTGGAIANAAIAAGLRDWILVMNGDSLASFSLPDMEGAVVRGADAAMAAARVEDAARFGTLSVRPDGSLAGFVEKSGKNDPGLINAGVYLMHASSFMGLDLAAPCSIESDLFPRWLGAGRRIAVLATSDPFLDIGVPDSLARADAFVATPRRPESAEVQR